jgi:hypothetical protein
MAYIGHQGAHKYLLWDGKSVHSARDISFTNQNWVEYMEAQRQNQSDPNEPIGLIEQSQPIQPATPQSYQEAITSPEAYKWRASMHEEINAHIANGTWIEVPKASTGKQRVLSGK